MRGKAVMMGLTVYFMDRVARVEYGAESSVNDGVVFLSIAA